MSSCPICGEEIMNTLCRDCSAVYDEEMDPKRPGGPAFPPEFREAKLETMCYRAWGTVKRAQLICLRSKTLTQKEKNEMINTAIQKALKIQQEIEKGSSKTVKMDPIDEIRAACTYNTTATHGPRGISEPPKHRQSLLRRLLFPPD